MRARKASSRFACSIAQVVGDDLVAGQDGGDGLDAGCRCRSRRRSDRVRSTRVTSGRSVSSRVVDRAPTAGTGAAAPGRPSRRCPAGVSSAMTRPGAEDGDAIGEPLGLLHQVGDEQDGHAAVADRLDELPRLAAGLRVEPGRELVEDRDPRPADERQGDRQALLLAAREVAVGRVALVVEPEVVDQLARVGRLRRRTRRTARAPRATVIRSGSSLSWSWTPTSGPQPVAVPPRIEPEDADRARSRASADRRSTRRSWSCRRRSVRGCRRSRPPRPRTRRRRRRRGRRSACVRSVTSMTFMGQASQWPAADPSVVCPEPHERLGGWPHPPIG